MDFHLPQEDIDIGPSPLVVHPTIHFHFEERLEDSYSFLTHKWESSGCALATSCSSIVSSPSPSSSLFDPSTSDLDAISPSQHREQDYYTSYTQQENSMPRKHASLQSIFIPPFLLYPLPTLPGYPSDPTHSSARARSLSISSHSDQHIPSSSPPSTPPLASSRSSPPPDFLLDDDPFANYTGALPLQPHIGIPTSPPRSRRVSLSKRTSVKQPRSPLATEPGPFVSPSYLSSSPTPVQSNRSASSPSRASPPSPPVSGRQIRPAYTRPAFAPRPSLPSLHTLAQSDFIYSIKARKGTLGARLPLEPWDVSGGLDRAPEEAPSLQGFDHGTDHTHSSSDSPLGPESYVGILNEVVHISDVPRDTTDTRSLYKNAHALDVEAPLLQSPVSFEFGPEEGSQMFTSLFDVLSSFSSSERSRSPSTSSSSSVPVLSPDSQAQWDGDSPTQSPNRCSFEESMPIDLSVDDDTTHPSSKANIYDIRYLQDTDFVQMPGGLSAADSFQPGTSAGTIRPPVNSLASDDISIPFDEDRPSSCGDYATPEFDEADMFDESVGNMDEAVDSNDRGDRNNGRTEGNRERRSSSGYRGGVWDRRQVNGGSSHNTGRGSAGDGRDGGGGDDHWKDERDWRALSAFSTPSDTESEESEEEDTRHPTQRSRSTGSVDVSTSGDDNVPLAQSIPTALRAQRTIRKQVRDEKDERRRLRALQRQQHQQTPIQMSPDEVSRHHAQIGSGPKHAPSQFAPSSSRPSRSRTRTLPTNSARPIAAEDLAKRLRDIQEKGASTTSLNRHQHSPSDSGTHADHARVPSVGGVQGGIIRPTRSFHHPSPTDTARVQPVPMPSLPYGAHRLGRSATTSASRSARQHDPSETSPHAKSALLLKSSRRPRTSDGAHQPSAALIHPSAFQHVSVPRISADVPDPSTSSPIVSMETKQVSWQQRVFIVDLQRFNTLLMTPATTAKEVIDVLEAQGQLANWAGMGGWMLFEVSQDFGMERPIRHFEVVSEVISSWDKDKSVNLLVVKKTPLAALLHPSAMPSSSPVFGTYVEWESKPRKWSKRWLELREQGLWLSKKDNGKDETFLCSLANFDAYVVTRPHKSPKPYVFAVKSTDNLTFFENAADYVHVFCCSEKDGRKWLESVLLARSYFINQERNTLSVGAVSASGAAPGKSLSRSGTRKGSRNVQQPLVQVSPITTATTATQAYVFEPGSLLAKR